MANLLLKAFGDRLRALRMRKGISQERLAELAGMHRTYLGGIERGERNPTLLTLAKIARALGISMSHLLDVDSRED